MNQSPHGEWWHSSGAAYQSPTSVTGSFEAQDSAFPFWTLIVFTFILIISPQEFFPALASLRIALLMATVAITIYILDRFTHRQPITIRTREMYIITCLVGWAILTIPLSYWPGGSLSFLLSFYSKTLALFWLLSNIVNTLPRLRLIVWVLSLMAVLPAASGVNQYLSGNFLMTGGMDRIAGYQAPLTSGPNDLALTLNLILPLALALFLSYQTFILRMMLLGIIALYVVAIIVTFSRGGFLTLATTFVMYQWKLRKRQGGGWAAVTLVIALLCIPLMPSSYFDRLRTIKDIEADQTTSAQARWDDMIAAVRLVIRNPIIGAGVGMDALALNEERGASWHNVHNVYLQYAVDLGIPGLVLFLLLLVGCIECAGFSLRHSAGVPDLREAFHLAEGIQISLVAFSVAALFHPVAYHIHFFYVAGLAVAAKAMYRAEDRNARSQARG